MRNSLSTLKKQMLTLAFVCLGFPLMAEQVTITVDSRDAVNTGTTGFSNLEQAFVKAEYNTPEKLAAITDLKVVTVGKYPFNDKEFDIALDSNDFVFLNTQLTGLANLDLSEALVTNNYGEGRNANNSIPNNAFFNNTTIKSIQLPSTVVSIGANAFVNCALEGIINLPKSINGGGNIECGRFGNSQGITGFQADEESTVITTIDGVVFSKDMTNLHFYPCGKTDESYTIPEGVITIRNSAFEHNHHLKNLTFASTTTTPQAGANRFDVIANQSEIENIYVAQGNNVFGSSNGVLYQLEGNRAVWSPKGKLAVRLAEPVQKIAGGGSQNSIFGGNGKDGATGLSNNYTNVITLLDLPATLEEVENGAFVGAEDLGKIICRATVAPKTGISSFREVGKNHKYNTLVYVPANSLEAYKASNWVDKAVIDGITYSGFAESNFFAFYNISLTDATAESSLANDIAAEGDMVTITANEAPAGKEFDKWTTTSAEVTFTDANAETTTFTMPAGDVEIVATYKTPTNISEGNQAEETSIYTNSGIIYINTDKAQTVNIYSIDGRIIKSVELNAGKNMITGIMEGIYLVNKQKIVLK